MWINFVGYKSYCIRADSHKNYFFKIINNIANINLNHTIFSYLNEFDK